MWLLQKAKSWVQGLFDQPNGVPKLDGDGHLVGTIIARNGTAAALASVVPALGELAIATDTMKLVIGDGVSTFAALAEQYTGLLGDSTSTIAVRANGTAAENGTALLAAYTAAKALTPNGAALSATNRACLLIFPGVYDLDASVLTLDTDYIDLIGVGGAKFWDVPSPLITSTGNTITNSTTAMVLIKNIAMDMYYPSGTDLAWLEDCYIEDMRYGIAYTGRYIRCKSISNRAYGGGNGGIASGYFEQVDASTGQWAFGGNGGSCSGTFVDCIGGNGSFGGIYGPAPGADGDVSGKLYGCRAGNYSFGYNADIAATARLYNCIAGTNSYGTKDASAKAFFCVANDAQYAGND